jgi:hypothetical protein
MSGQRVWKIIKDLGKRIGVDTIHPHAFRHACGVELLKRSGGNLRAVQERLRHADIQTGSLATAPSRFFARYSLTIVRATSGKGTVDSFPPFPEHTTQPELGLVVADVQPHDL